MTPSLIPSPHRRQALHTLLALAAIPALQARAQKPATVVAASDLKFALEDIAARFEREQGRRVRLVFGSSGQFTAQILQGAPFDLFLSADEALVARLHAAGKTLDAGQPYALGRIGLMVPQGSPLQPDGSLQDLAAALKDGRLKKFAIANPAHAPYGARAQEALQHAGLWAAIQPHLVLGENIAQAAQYATSGATQGGIIALSLARAESIGRLGRFALIPAEWHQPLRQRMVLLKGASDDARAFHAYLSTPSARAVMDRYGFGLPR